MKAEAARKREEIEQREKEKDKPVDDAEMIRDLFGFLPTDQTADGEGERKQGQLVFTTKTLHLLIRL